MVDSVSYEAFLVDKKGFFSEINSTKGAKNRAIAQSYQFLATNQLSIEQEFNQMFASLKKQGKDRKEFWLYCYYCCTMLENYYDAYDKKSKAADYRNRGKELKLCCDTGKFPKKGEVDSLGKKIAADFGSLLSTPLHTSKMSDWIGFTNIYRIHFVFCRLSVKQSLLLARELQWLEKLDRLFGMHTNADAMVAIINAPAPVFYAMSVGLFAARFIINAGLLIKHTISTSATESSIDKIERFYQEIYARGFVMLNDVVWGSVNLLCNYAPLFNISAATAGWLTAGFMIFDVSLLLARRCLAEREYTRKKEQYEYELNNYNTLAPQALTPEDEAKRKMLNEQLVQLEINWRATRATYLFNIGAALLLMAGFSASMLLATPAAIVACYFVCTVAVAMYLTADIFGKYIEKSLILELQKFSDKNEQNLALNTMLSAKYEFGFAMAKTIIMPLLIVTAFAVCWQAALLLTALYISYECTRGYLKNEPPEDEPLQLHAPDEAVEEDGDYELGAAV